MTYPLKFRQHVLGIKEQGSLTFAETALRFSISMSSLMRWTKNPEPVRGHNKPATKINSTALSSDIETYPDAYQYERAQRLGVSTRGICHAMKRLGYSRKKTFAHPKADDVARFDFRTKIHDYQAAGKPIIYIDESGFSLDMPRHYGWSSKGTRCYGKRDWQARGRINVTGALLNNRLLNVGLFDGNINSDVFYAWMTQEVLPQAPPEAVIVLDNAAFHKRKDIQAAVKEAGMTLEYLPHYSPDLNPIGHKWAQAKALRRKLRCDVHDLFSNALF